MKKQIEQTLGYELDTLQYRHLKNLNELPMELVIEARKLPSNASKIWFLKYYVREEELPYLQGFINDVIDGGGLPQTWLKGGFLTIDCSLKDQLTLPRQAILAEIGYPFFYRRKLDFISWKQGVNIGSPAKFDPTLTYHSSSINNTIRFTLNYDSFDSVSMEDNDVVYLQWNVQRIARYLLSKNLLIYPVNLEMFKDISSVENWSDDASKALYALNQELNAKGYKDGLVPGYTIK